MTRVHINLTLKFLSFFEDASFASNTEGVFSIIVFKEDVVEVDVASLLSICVDALILVFRFR